MRSVLLVAGLAVISAIPVFQGDGAAHIVARQKFVDELNAIPGTPDLIRTSVMLIGWRADPRFSSSRLRVVFNPLAGVIMRRSRRRPCPRGGVEHMRHGVGAEHAPYIGLESCMHHPLVST